MAIEIVSGKRARIIFDGGICIHSRHCVLSRPDVFVPNVDGEWIHPDRATPDEIAELAHACPSGAIRYELTDGGGERAPLVNTAQVRENGPLAFSAELRMSGAEAGFRATLCRCGASHNKPFCDGSHAAAGFSATGEPAVGDKAQLKNRNGPLEVAPVRNGPLHVIGALEVVTGTGKTVGISSDTWFCRCGHSANKPYCDGSHKRVGFSSEN